jgi:hypothetical protein
VVAPAELRRLAEVVAPVTLARDHGLPVDDALASLLPDATLARGSVVGVAGGPGVMSLALALAAGASRAGSWTVVVGLPELGLAAAAELGVVLDRLALVAVPPHDPATWAPTLAALVGAVDVIVVDARLALRPGEIRRLVARARERGSVLVPVAPGTASPSAATRGGSARARRVPVGDWPTDVTLSPTATEWEGLADGHGSLRRRRVSVRAEGRGRAARARQCDLWLPAAGGGVAPAGSEPGGPVVGRPDDGGEAALDDALGDAVARTERFLRSVPAGRQVS